MDIFELSELLISDSDKKMIEDISNHSYQELMSDIHNSDYEVIGKIYSEEKIINNYDMNKKGLHIYRIILAKRIEEYRRRKYSFQNEYTDTWENDGIIIIPDFLEHTEYSSIKNLADQKIKDSEKFYLDLSSNKKFQEIVSMAAAAPSNISSLGSERIEFDVIDTEEEQYNLHSDTFQPCVKVFYYINEIKEDEGPFCFVKGSTKVDNPKLLKWLYDASCISLDDSSDLLYEILPAKLGVSSVDTWGKNESTTFSPRLGRNVGDDILNQRLNNMDLPIIQPIIGKGNTLVIANTSGFHRRGRAKQGVIRTTLRSGQRFNPFII
jgi:hypothetical protein